MLFSIVTPSLGQLGWLKMAIRSVADQKVSYEHLIQDGGTGPELERWVREHSSAQLHVEADQGMYDALNRGFARTQGEILAWLNCDEQYLPGALQAVEERFARDAELDVLLADNLVVDLRGDYLAHRFSLVPNLAQMWVRFPVASCAMFFRRRVWRPFDSQWKSAGDWCWFREMLRNGAKVEILRQFVSSFAETTANLGLGGITKAEQAQIVALRPWWAKAFSPLLLAVHRWRMWRSGAFAVKPFKYALYVEDEAQRREFAVDRPTARWIRRRGPTLNVDPAK